MTDSESDTSNAFINFQNDITTVNAKGPNTNFSFRNPMTSMYNMSQNFERQRYAESAYNQRSMYCRRETSPMSIQSACDIRPQNYQRYPCMGSRSVFNGRSGSPMSMRSIDSSVSVSAADIAFAFKNAKFNKNDLKMIRDAYQKLLKQRVRKRIEKRRNRLLLKTRRRSGDDSGDQASDSSVSSDDYRSVKTYKENMSSSKSERMLLTDFRKKIRDCNMLKDSTDHLSQTTLKNKFSAWSTSGHKTQNLNNTVTSNQFNSTSTQKDRFRNGFLLPSQRFNRSVASTAILEHSEKPHNSTGDNLIKNVRNHHAQNKHNRNKCPSGSEEEIFSEMTTRETSTFNINSQYKRTLDSEDESSLPVSKKSRIASPAKSAQYNKRSSPKVKNMNPSNSHVELSNSFQFAKPSVPVRKSKPRVQEKLIAKSAQPLIDYLEPTPSKTKDNIQIQQPSNLQEKSSESLTQLEQSETTQTSDVSSRPSFIKRKLFTQRLDVAEKANLSTDSTNSPQTSVYSLQKEKSKARKLVTNQSCLNREVEDDNNLLDLIHKIVPPDRMSVTNQTTMSVKNNDVSNKKEKWDVTSVISMCNDDDVSDTYTDEEIFEADNTTKPNAKNKDINTKAKPVEKVVTKTLIPDIKNKPKPVDKVATKTFIPDGYTKAKPADKVVTKTLGPQNCKVVLNKLENNNTLQKQVVNQNFNVTHNNVTKNNGTISGKTFWDTDFESDAECQTVLQRSHILDNSIKANPPLDNTKQNFKNPIGYAKNNIFKKNPELPKQLNNSWMNKTVSTFNNIHKQMNSSLSVRSHRTSKKKKCCNETFANQTLSKLDNLGDKKQSHFEKPVDNVGTLNLKTDIPTKNITNKPKAKLNTQNETKTTTTKSTTQSVKSPKGKKSIKDKRAVTSKNENKKIVSKAKLEKTSNANSKKNNIETQNNNAKIKNKPEKQNDITQVLQNQQEKEKSPKRKPKSDNQSTKQKNPLSKPTNLNLNNTVQNTSFSGRPIRSCRNSSQSRSIEISGQLNNTSVDMNKSLRSRVINLSSSIENITIKITSKAKKNQNISLINKRKSDVSFSLGSKEQTPVPKRTSARSRADFCKGKR